jgi:phosphoglycerate dehydrogenase-like enzyme
VDGKKEKTMNSLNDKLYLLTESNSIYRQALQQKSLAGLEFTEERSEATIVIAEPPLAAKCLDDFPKMEWLQSTFAGVDKLMVHGLRQDYLLTNVKGVFGPLIAEYVIGYLTSYFRHFSFYQQQQNQANWTPQPYKSLVGQRMVILGTGVIGAYLAQVAKSFGMTLVGVNRSGIPPKNSPFDQLFHIAELERALSGADIVVNTLPNTSHTYHLLNQQSFSACHDVLLFNVGRGATLDESALIPSIEAGYIQHAFLDVFEQEPLEAEHPFWGHPKVTVTPHIAAVSFPEQVVDIFAESYQHWCLGLEPQFMVDFEKGY